MAVASSRKRGSGIRPTSRTIAMRSKEEAHDYRYFPEPDLPPVEMVAARVAQIAGDVPELPAARRARFIADHRLPAYDAIELTRERAVADYFEAVVAAGAPPKAASNWVMGEMARKLNDTRTRHRRGACQRPEPWPDSSRSSRAATISTTTAKDVFEKMWASGPCRARDRRGRRPGADQRRIGDCGRR